MPLPYNPVAHVRTDGVRFIDVLTDHGLDQPVPSCPGWDLGDLGWHLGNVWNFWARIVSEGLTDLDQVRAIDSPSRPSDELLLDWISISHNSLNSALSRARPDRAVWTWTGNNRDALWVRRRMTQETAVHRWDAAHAVGLPYKVPAAVAADGIDEFLSTFAGRNVADGAEAVGGSVHLHCTDTSLEVAEGRDDRSMAGGEWLVSTLDESGATFTRQHAKGDAAVRGRAHDLLMWIWGRDAGAVEIIGDEEVAQRFRGYTART
jgi:uncharacterized protein (TIGR03083 family)